MSIDYKVRKGNICEILTLAAGNAISNVAWQTLAFESAWSNQTISVNTLTSVSCVQTIVGNCAAVVD